MLSFIFDIFDAIELAIEMLSKILDETSLAKKLLYLFLTVLIMVAFIFFVLNR